MIVVTTTAGEEESFVGGVSWEVNKQGHLLVHDAKGQRAAIYAAERWTSAKREPQNPAGQYAG